MSLTTGPRQFNFQSPKQRWTIDESVVPTNGWNKRGPAMWYQQKLDLRAFSEEENKGLDILNVAIQEGGIYSYSDSVDHFPVMMVLDIISSVKLRESQITDMLPVMHDGNFPSFLGNLKDDNQKLNTSQVIYGQWRAFAANANLNLGSGSAWGERGLQVFQAGSFGQGEIIVGPAAYYTRAVFTFGGTVSCLTYVPANIVVCSGGLVEMKGFQELNQMARMSAR